MKLQKIYDFRTMGQIFDGVPLTVWVECAKEDGSAFEGWYILSDDPKYHHHIQGQYYFYQSKLTSGKICQRKVSEKINKTLIDIIKCNIDQVEDYAKLYQKVVVKHAHRNDPDKITNVKPRSWANKLKVED